MKMQHKAARCALARDWPDEFAAHQLTCSDEPDMSGVNRAAEANAAIAKEALNWYREVYADTAPDRKAAAQAGREQAALQRDLTLQSMQTQREERARYKNTFQPIEQKIAADAMGYDTPQRREAAAGQAMADLDSQFSRERETAMNTLASRGVDPSSGSAALALARGSVGAGAAKAAAGNQARERVETLGAAKMADAAGIGRGVFTNQTTQAQIGLQAGNSSVTNANVPNVVAQQGANMMQQGFQTGIQGNQSAGQLYGQAAEASKSDNSGLWSAVGSAAGMMMMSDKNQKKDKKPVKGEVALAAARRMPVKSWRYKQGSPADDGGARHVGPMAQDVQRVLGDTVAPDGKMVDVISLAGVTLAAVQQLDKKVDKLAKRRRTAAH